MNLREQITQCLMEDLAWAHRASRHSNGYTLLGGTHWQWADAETGLRIEKDLSTVDFVDENANRVSLQSKEVSLCHDKSPHVGILCAQEVEAGVGGHIVRHSPARVIRQMSALQRILFHHDDLPCPACANDPDTCPTIQDIARIWNDDWPE